MFPMKLYLLSATRNLSFVNMRNVYSFSDHLMKQTQVNHPKCPLKNQITAEKPLVCDHILYIGSMMKIILVAKGRGVQLVSKRTCGLKNIYAKTLFCPNVQTILAYFYFGSDSFVLSRGNISHNLAINRLKSRVRL